MCSSDLYHITNGIPINKFELLSLIKKATGRDITINAIEGRIVDKSLIDTRRERSYNYPSYSQMIKEMVEMMKKNRILYKQYKIV